MDAWIAGGVFLVAYALIAAERIDRTLVALLGGLSLMVAMSMAIATVQVWVRYVARPPTRP